MGVPVNQSLLGWEKNYAFRLAERATRLVKARLVFHGFNVDKINIYDVPYRNDRLIIGVDMINVRVVDPHEAFLLQRSISPLFKDAEVRVFRSPNDSNENTERYEVDIQFPSQLRRKLTRRYGWNK